MKVVIGILLTIVCLPLSAQVVTPPGQPTDGPGGSGDYVYDRVKVTSYGEGVEQYWIFEPAAEIEINAAPLPVVLYVHGLNAISPNSVRAWINHIVMRGHILIYPAYQTTGIERPTEFTSRTATATKEAIARLDGKEHHLADTDRFAMLGHSLGGTIIANLAAAHRAYGLPKPAAMMCVTPGDTRADRGIGALLPSLVEDHAALHRDLLMLVITAEEDQIVGDRLARRIFNAAMQVPDANKDFVTIRSDRHGNPPLVADHFVNNAPLRDGRPIADALDYFGLWKLFDALTAAAFHGRDREYALGNTPEQRYMGTWSDGTAVKELVVSDEP
jgi:acetyl esterase/lipase